MKRGEPFGRYAASHAAPVMMSARTHSANSHRPASHAPAFDASQQRGFQAFLQAGRSRRPSFFDHARRMR